MDAQQQETNAKHGAAIRALREACVPRMSQAELSKRLDMAQGSISSMERGATRCPVALAHKIAHIIAGRSELAAWQAAVWIVMGEAQ